MMFFAVMILLVGVLGAVFWLSIPGSEGLSTIKSKLLTISAFIFLSLAVYAINGEPGYVKPRLATHHNDLARALQPGQVNPLEAYGALIVSGDGTKTDWLDIATQLQTVQRPVEFADAVSHAAKLATDSSEKAHLLGASGEALVQANGGAVTEDASEKFVEALKHDPNSLGALYYLGRKARADNQSELARDYWQQFLRLAAEDHDLVSEVRANLVLIDAGRESDPSIAPVLTPEMIDRLAGLSEQDRQNRIVVMLNRAHERLEQQGRNASASQWRELARAFVRIDNKDRAITAYDKALELAPEDTAIQLERSQLIPR